MIALVSQPASGRHDEDLALARLASRGDKQAQRLVANRLVGRVRRVARAIIKNVEDADDVAQQAMISVLTHVGSYRGESSLERWADRITARKAISEAKRLRKGAMRVAEDCDLGQPPSSTTVDESLPRPLDHYLDQLSPARREALVLKHALGHSVDEISELLGVPRGTVKDRLVSARKQMRGWITRDLELGVGPGRAFDQGGAS